MDIGVHQSGPTYAKHVERTLTRHPDRIAFQDASGAHTYRDVLDLISRYQEVLTAAGLERGQGIAALGSNRYEVFVLGAAAQSVGIYITVRACSPGP